MLCFLQCRVHIARISHGKYHSDRHALTVLHIHTTEYCTCLRAHQFGTLDSLQLTVTKNLFLKGLLS